MKTFYWCSIVLLVLFSFYNCTNSSSLTGINIISPEIGETFSHNDSLSIKIQLDAAIGANYCVMVYIDDSLIAELTDYPYQTKVNCSQYDTDVHTLKVIEENSKRKFATTTFSIVGLREVPEQEVDFKDTNSVYLNGYMLAEENNSHYLATTKEKGELLFEKNFVTPGSIAIEMKNTGGKMAVYSNSKLISALFPVRGWKTYYFYASQGLNSIRIEYSEPGVMIKRIDLLEGIAKHSVGEYWGGGVVILVDSTFEHGTIACEKDIGEYEWGCSDLNITKENSGVGNSDGWYNTIWIVENCNDTNSAARKCFDFVLHQQGNSFTDWYLPTTGELKAVYRLKDYFGHFLYESYWTSYAYDTYAAGLVLFTNGSAHGSYRYTARGVLPVRAF